MTELTLVIGNKNYSSWSLRPWLVMKQAGLEFSEIRIPLFTADSRQKILHHSPTGKVPVLHHRETTVWESLAICEYIAEQFDASLWSNDRKLRAIARSVSHEMHGGFFALRQHMPMNCRARFSGQGTNDAVQTDIDRITTIWRNARQTYGSDGNFLFGPFTIADAMFAPVVSRFMTYGVELGTVEQAYADSIWQLPAMQDWLDAAHHEKEIAEVEAIAHNTD